MPLSPCGPCGSCAPFAPFAPFRRVLRVLYCLASLGACLGRLAALVESPSAFLTSFVGDGAPRWGIANETATTSARAAITTFLFTTVHSFAGHSMHCR